MKKDVNLDARLRLASLLGERAIIQQAKAENLTVDQVKTRLLWLDRQPKTYRQEVKIKAAEFAALLVKKNREILDAKNSES